jgi:hypothetical protein
VSKKYFIFDWNRGDNWEEHVTQVREGGVIREGTENTIAEAQVVQNKHGERRARVRQRDAAIGLDSEDVHMGGDRVVIEAELPQSSGDVTVVGHRYSDSGKFLGTYEFGWDKTDSKIHTLARKRRVFY